MNHHITSFLHRPLPLALLAVGLGLAAAPACFAQVVSITRSPATVHFDARASAQVQPDTYVAMLSTQEEGADLAAVNDKVSVRIDRAVKAARAAGVTVHTTGYTTWPHYTTDAQNHTSRRDGWTVRAGLEIQSESAGKISALATKLGAQLQIDSIGAKVSAKQRAAEEDKLTGEAIAQFQAKAAAIAKDFGSAHYTLGAITVGNSSPVWAPGPQPMVMAAMARAAAPVPVAPGKQTVSVDVSGSVQLDH